MSIHQLPDDNLQCILITRRKLEVEPTTVTIETLNYLSDPYCKYQMNCRGDRESKLRVKFGSWGFAYDRINPCEKLDLP